MAFTISNCEDLNAWILKTERNMKRNNFKDMLLASPMQNYITNHEVHHVNSIQTVYLNFESPMKPVSIIILKVII